MAALTKKRFLTFKRDKKMWAFVVLMPAFFVLVGILILLSIPSYSEPALVLSPAEYNSGSAPFPYAMECTVNTSTCDTPELIAQMDISGDAEAMDLDIVATTEDDGAVELMNQALLDQTTTDKVYGAVSFRDVDTAAGTFDYTVHANYSGLHSFPLYVNQINTAILRIVGGNDDLSITTTMHPMPRTAYEKDIDSGFDSFSVSIFMMIAYCFVPAAWIAFIVREKETKCKHQQV